jgi:hypothetical protein
MVIKQGQVDYCENTGPLRPTLNENGPTLIEDSSKTAGPLFTVPYFPFRARTPRMEQAGTAGKLTAMSCPNPISDSLEIISSLT